METTTEAVKEATTETLETTTATTTMEAVETGHQCHQ